MRLYCLFIIKILCFIGVVAITMAATVASVAFAQSAAGLLVAPIAALVGLIVFGYISVFAEDKLAPK